MMKNHIKDFAKSLNNESLLILGGTGLFGKTLLPALVKEIEENNINTKITIVTRNKSNALANIPVLKKTIFDLIEFDFLLGSEFGFNLKCSYILHMAATAAQDTFSGISQIKKYQLLVNSTNFVSKLINYRSVKRVVFVSSGIAYGDVAEYREGIFGHINHLDPSSSLALGKVSAEYILKNICDQTDTELSIARCFSFISKFLPLDIHYAIGNFVKAAIDGEDIIIRGDGKDIRSYQHVEDAVDWISYLITNEKPPLIMNIGSDESLSIENLALLVKKLVNQNCKILVQNKKPPKDNRRRLSYVPCLNLAYKLGLEQTKSLEYSINELAQTYKHRVNE